jgi:hypothetical protein
MLSAVTFAVLWPFVDKPLGGRTILVVSESNGITTGDFLSVLAVGIVAFQASRQLRRKRRRDALTDPPQADSPQANSPQADSPLPGT